MPHLQLLIDQGASGQISTLHPPLSPMLWTSIATGKRPFKHGIHGFSEPAPGGRGVQPVTNLSRTSKAVWNILNQNLLRSVVIGWWPSHPAEPIDGVMVSDHYQRAHRPLEQGWPLLANAVHPPELAGVLASLRVHPDSVTPEMVEPFIPLAREIDQDQDKRLGMFLRMLAECSSIHAAAMHLLSRESWDFFTVYYDAIDHFCHGFMRYHPPRQSWIAQRDFELYHRVVSEAYQMHDRMLGELLERAGPGVTVMLMSDHGFHPDHLRPSSIPDIPAGPAIEHRDFGILAIRGQGIRKNHAIYGSSVLDLAPTVLTLFGLPAGEDMDGRALTGAFERPPRLSFIPSWEFIPGPDGRHPKHTRLDPAAAHAALEQMIALGYIERPDENREVAVRKTIRDLRYNLAESYQDAGRHLEALAILEELYAADPDEQRFAVTLFVSCQALRRGAQMRHIVEELELRRHLPRHQPQVVDYLRSQVLIEEQRYSEALAILEQIPEAHLVRPGVFLQLADLYQRQRRWREAQSVCERALEIDPDNVPARLGVCRMALRRRQFSQAAHSALDALQRVHQDPQAHYLLGLALTGMKQYRRAGAALRAAISFNPNYPEAHLRLAGLFEKHLGDSASARKHRSLARSMRRKGAPAVIPSSAPQGDDVEAAPAAADPSPMPPLERCLIVVSGLPRSGTSMVMQMLNSAGVPLLSDGLRQADEDNPRGYFEFAPVKGLLKDSRWLAGMCGKAVKIVAPLVTALPPDLPCRVILCLRDLNEVLDSQDRMLVRRNRAPASPARRTLLHNEYARLIARLKVDLCRRFQTRLLVLDHRHALSHPLDAAVQLNRFLGGELDIAKMAAAIQPALHRNRGGAVETR